MSAPSRDRTILDLELELAVLVRRVKRVVAERAHLIDPDLGAAGYVMLAYMAERGPMRASVMAEAFALDKGAVSRQVQSLVDLGLATKERDPEDGRAWVVDLTDDGAHRLDALAARRRERLEQRLEDWGDDELGSFVAMLGRYNASLE